MKRLLIALLCLSQGSLFTMNSHENVLSTIQYFFNDAEHLQEMAVHDFLGRIERNEVSEDVKRSVLSTLVGGYLELGGNNPVWNELGVEIAKIIRSTSTVSPREVDDMKYYVETAVKKTDSFTRSRAIAIATELQHKGFVSPNYVALLVQNSRTMKR